MASDASSWAPAGDRGRALIPAVGAWTLAPDDGWIAWTEAAASREIHVTDLSSMRTALTLSGVGLAALHAPSPDTLWVVRRKGQDATLHVHAVPDGGEVSRVSLPNLGVWNVVIQASFDGRTAMIGKAVRGTFDGRMVSTNYLLRGDGLEEVTPLDPFALLGANARELSAQYVLDPDGRSLAIAHAALVGANPRTHVSLLELASRRVTQVAIVEAPVPRHLHWISSSRVLLVANAEHQRTSLFSVDVEQGATRFAQLSALDHIRFERGVAVHPDRDRALLVVERARDRNGSSTRSVAMVCSLAGSSPPALLGLASDKGPVGTARYGGACWDRAGRLLTATSPTPREAHIALRDSVSEAPRAVTHIPLHGASPHLLALSLSPRGALAVVTWNTLDRGEAEAVRRLALVIL